MLPRISNDVHRVKEGPTFGSQRVKETQLDHSSGCFLQRPVTGVILRFASVNEILKSELKTGVRIILYNEIYVSKSRLSVHLSVNKNALK